MLITERVKINNKEFIYNYSDEQFYIQKNGTDELYEDAYDLPEKGYTYTETDKKIEDEDESSID